MAFHAKGASFQIDLLGAKAKSEAAPGCSLSLSLDPVLVVLLLLESLLGTLPGKRYPILRPHMWPLSDGLNLESIFLSAFSYQPRAYAWMARPSQAPLHTHTLNN